MVTRKTVAVAPAAKAGARVALKTKPTEVAGATKRVAISARRSDESSDYFTSDKDGLQFFSTGCVVMDEALGGGWCLGRVSNVVGDRSSGKTLLATEATANFAITFPDGDIRYAESEAAFDEAYAEALGTPIDRIKFNPKGEAMRTVEQFYKDLIAFVRQLKGRAGLYILDSLDALSDDAEQKREMDEGSYSMTKQKKMSEMFRRVTSEVEDARCHLMVISQIRDKIGVTFGETKTRSGGKALDFYCTHIVWLAESGKIKRTIDKVERVTGVDVRVNVKKNKVGLPFRQCSYPILFGYGIDDVTASVEWLLEVGREDRLEAVGMSKAGYKVRIGNLRNKGGEEMREVRRQLSTIVKEEWRRIDRAFLPKSRKY